MSRSKRVPKIVTCLREGYSWGTLRSDVLAGLIVGVVALPLSIAFAIASGVRPEQGLYTAVIAGFLISLLSGCRFQVGGPTGAFVVLVFSVVSQFGYPGLALATLLAGVLMLLMGALRLGTVIQYIPYPVTIGFTSGIALIIFSGQLASFLGITLQGGSPKCLPKIWAVVQSLGALNLWSLSLGLATVFIVVFWPRISRKVPGSIVALLLLTALSRIFQLPVESIGDRFGQMPTGFPAPHLPSFDWSRMGELLPFSISIALLGSIESLLSAVVADGMTGTRHRPNMELIAQGVANIFSPFFGGIPATGAIARTATNIKNGARSPVAGIVHALTLLAILLFFGKWAALIPIPVLAGLLIVVAYNMGEWHLFARIMKKSRSDMAVLLATFLLTVLVDLTVAIQVGVLLAALLFMKRMVDVSAAVGQQVVFPDESEVESTAPELARDIPEGVMVFEINGPFFFGVADKFADQLRASGLPKVLILRMRHVPAMDATGVRALDGICSSVIRGGGVMILSGVQPQPQRLIENGGLLKRYAGVRLAENIDQALSMAQDLKKEVSNA